MESGPSPLVHRSVRAGAVLVIFGAVEFVAGMVVVQLRYPHYSLTQNYISDLGGASSPWALVFDASVILLGVCAVFGIPLIGPAFERRPSRGIGLTLVLIGGIGAIGVGVFPETTPVLHGQMHVIVSFLAFVGASVGLLVLSFAMAGNARWKLSRPFTFACGLVALVATGFFAAGVYFGLGPGGMERLIVAPILLWGAAEGAHLYRLPRFAPPGLPRERST